ncbi:MAG: transcriptional regulator, IclR family, partial [Klenkia sp.]|nr:transcriptional regulator, IclR family [Klenkia sp.]
MGQPNPVAVLDKAVAILHAVATEPATLAELVSRTGLPRATAHRLAVAREGHRLVRRNPDGAWTPGPVLAELAR